jgi:RNA processing factor Prp31
VQLEDLYAIAFSEVDCEVYEHSDLCYYLLEVVHENLYSKRRLRDLQALLLEFTAALEEILHSEET